MLTSLLWDVFGHLYINVTLAFGIGLYLTNPKLIIIVFSLVWQSDTGGLLFGKLFGNQNLKLSVSPNKTIQGFIGSYFYTCFSAFLMYLISHYWSDYIFLALEPRDFMILGVTLTTLAITSDLIESWIKRCAGEKDSGSYFPGHGGFFDRVDSSLLAMPFAYWYNVNYLNWVSDLLDFEQSLEHLEHQPVFYLQVFLQEHPCSIHRRLALYWRPIHDLPLFVNSVEKEISLELGKDVILDLDITARMPANKEMLQVWPHAFSSCHRSVLLIFIAIYSRSFKSIIFDYFLLLENPKVENWRLLLHTLFPSEMV